MPSPRRGVPLLVWAVLVLVALAGYQWLTRSSGLLDASSSSAPRYTAEELRARPDVTEVLPGTADAARAVLEAVSRTASVTWEPVDTQVFTHETDGDEPQVVDGFPVLRWTPQQAMSVETTDLDEAAVERLAGTFREVLEERDLDVHAPLRPAGAHPHKVAFTATDGHGGRLELWDTRDGRLYLVVTSGPWLFRDPSCDPDPLTCFPTAPAVTPHA